MIALHSYDGLAETGLLGCPAEKELKSLQPTTVARFLRSGFRAKSRNTGIVRVFRRKASEISLQSTVWRREVDSNPRYGFANPKPRHIRKLQMAKPYQRISH